MGGPLRETLSKRRHAPFGGGRNSSRATPLTHAVERARLRSPHGPQAAGGPAGGGTTCCHERARSSRRHRSANANASSVLTQRSDTSVCPSITTRTSHTSGHESSAHRALRPPCRSVQRVPTSLDVSARKAREGRSRTAASPRDVLHDTHTVPRSEAIRAVRQGPRPCRRNLSERQRDGTDYGRQRAHDRTRGAPVPGGRRGIRKPAAGGILRRSGFPSEPATGHGRGLEPRATALLDRTTTV